MRPRTITVVFLTVFLDLVGFGIIIPIQPFYAESFGATPATVTLLGATYSVMQFLFAPLWGRLSDRVGRRPVMLVSVAASVAGFTLFGLAQNLAMLFAARALAGFGNANIGTAQAIIADSTSGEDRARGMGLIGAAFGLGFILGPALGGAFGQLGVAVPAYVAAGLSALNWGLALLWLPETRMARPGVPSRPAFGLSLEALRTTGRDPFVARVLALHLGLTLAMSLMEQVMALFIEHTWLGTSRGSGVSHVQQAAALTTYVLLAVGVTATVVQGALIGTLVRAFGERRLVVAGTLLLAASLASIPFAGTLGSFPLLVGLCVLLAAGSGVTTPSLSSLLSRAVPESEQGTALGLGQGLGALGRAVGPAVAGLLFETHRGLPFWVAAILMLGCAAVARPPRVRAPG